MDGEGTILPITYRPIILFTIGVWGWALNLFLLSTSGIEPISLLQLHQADNPLHRPVFFLSGILSVLVLIHLWFYWLYFAETMPSMAVLPYISAVMVLFWPGNSMYRKERARFIRMLRRVLSITLHAPVYFSDILLADMLTSFSNVFGDFFIASCMIFTGNNSSFYTENTEDIFYLDLMVPLLICLPYLIRLRQCISEYIETKEKRHLYNALKYASSIPMVIFSAVQRKASIYITQLGTVPSHWYLQEDSIFRFWILFVFLNSMYSFWWDVSMDWNMITISFDSTSASSTSPQQQQLQQQQQQQKISTATTTATTITTTTITPTGTPVIHFRRQLYFQQRKWYIIAIFLDFLLRMIWSLKLSSHIYLRHLEGSIFLIELLELMRRWVWVIFRMEAEWVKKVYTSLPLDALHMNLLDRKTPSGILSPIVEEEDP